VKICYEQKLRYVQYLQDVYGVTYHPTQQVKPIAVLGDNEEILGVVAYTGFKLNQCEMSVAATSPKCFSKRTLRAFFMYPFVQCQFDRVMAIAAVSNEKSIHFLTRLGFVQEGRLRRWFPSGEDGLIFSMLREECKL
jgi:ribosomal protein S18 acetylase RimI-like enzyme